MLILGIAIGIIGTLVAIWILTLFNKVCRHQWEIVENTYRKTNVVRDVSKSVNYPDNLLCKYYHINIQCKKCFKIKKIQSGKHLQSGSDAELNAMLKQYGIGIDDKRECQVLKLVKDRDET